MKKIGLFVLTVLVCVGALLALVACDRANQPGEGPDDGTTEQLPEEERLHVVLSGAAKFQIIRPEVTGTNPSVPKCAVTLRTALEERTGIKLELAEDYTGKGGIPEIDCEILVGETNREESAQAMEKLGDKDYGVYVIHQKICLVGRDRRGVELAVEAFMKSLYGKEGTFYVAKTLSTQGDFVLPENAYLIVPSATGGGADKYDQSVAISCLQGIMNRDSVNKVYVNADKETQGWLDLFRSEGRWLADKNFVELYSFEEFLEIGKSYLKKVVIWDENVPATLNVACTVAGVEDGIVLSPKMYEKYEAALEGLEVISLVGQFDGSITGSAKNDAYRWAIENYLAKGLCSTEYICSYIDGWSFRDKGNTSYTVVRNWGIYHRAFVFDLSPWGDEAPLDDPDQKIGTDKETLKMIFQYMLDATKDGDPYEVCGFFEHQKYSKAGENKTSTHQTVRTEWEYASVMTPYHGYHNTCIDNAWNESFHALYDGAQQLENNRPSSEIVLESDTVYLCFFMGDYDSTHPVYRYLKKAWDDPRRGEIPFAWAVNPNLLETYPDMIEYYYDTKTDNDYFVSDASAAGYFMPTKVPDFLWDSFLAHNKKYFERADMSIAPMILDLNAIGYDELSKLTQFAPDGIATVVQNTNAYMYGDTPVTALLAGGYDKEDPVLGAEKLEEVVNKQFNRSNSGASLNLLRCVWTTPTVICETVENYKAANPDKEVVVVDIYNYFDLVRQDLAW